MTSALVPIWILGAPFIAIMVLSSIFSGGSSALSSSDRTDIRGERLSPR